MFTLLANMPGHEKKSRYYALFLRLAAMKKDNPAQLKKEFGTVHFEQLKQQLTKKILQALRILHEDSDPQRQVNKHLANFQLLTERGLQKPAGRELLRAADIADAAKNTNVFPLIREQLFIYRRYSGADPLTVSRMEELLQYPPGVIVNEQALDSLLLEAERLNQSLEATRDKTELKTLERFRTNLLLTDETAVQTVRGRVLHFFNNGLVAYLRSEFEACARMMDKTAALLDAHPLLRQREEALYIRACANHALALLRLGRLDKFDAAFRVLKNFRPHHRAMPAYRDELVYVLHLMQLNRKKRFTEAIRLITTQPEHLNSNPTAGSVSQQQTYLVFETAAAYSGAGQPQLAARVMSSFIRQRGRGMKKDAYLMSRIFYLLLRFDLRDPDLIESELRAVRRLLKNENKLFLFEQKVLRFVDAMMTENAHAKIRAHFQQLRNDLQQLKKIPHERNAFLYFDFAVWVEKYLAR